MNDIELLDKLPKLSVLNEEQIQKITSRLPEYQRGKVMIGHRTSQTSYSLQTMNMISNSPLSRMKQCLAQIDKKFTALREAYFAVEEKKLRIKTLLKNNTENGNLTIRKLEGEIDEIGKNMETALRQIGMFQDMYDTIRKNNNIPEDWTEKDFEKQEIENMIRGSFRLGIQDLSATGRVSKAAVEYWEQLGIHPQLAELRVRNYLVNIQELLVTNQKVDISYMYKFLDSMVEEFKDEHTKALARVGLDTVGSEGFMAEGMTKPT